MDGETRTFRPAEAMGPGTIEIEESKTFPFVASKI
jgi:hypothetical protein